MPRERLRFSIESLWQINPAMLAPAFLIHSAIALMESYKMNPFPLDIRCDGIASLLIGSPSKLPIEIDWQAGTFPRSQRLFSTYQREDIVEYAAVAVAFILVAHIAECRYIEVTERGSRADYFLNDNRDFMLEISGTEDSKGLNRRHKDKVEQLLANPYGKGGYVVVCCFSNQTGWFSFH